MKCSIQHGALLLLQCPLGGSTMMRENNRVRLVRVRYADPTRVHRNVPSEAASQGRRDAAAASDRLRRYRDILYGQRSDACYVWRVAHHYESTDVQHQHVSSGGSSGGSDHLGSKNKTGFAAVVWRPVMWCVVVVACLVVALGLGAYFSYIGDITLPNRNVPHNIPTNPDVTSNITISDNMLPNKTWTINELMDLLQRHRSYHNNFHNTSSSQTIKSTPNATTPTTADREFCGDCKRPEHVCIKTSPNSVPECVRSRDRHDPTGCGGFCLVDKQYCKLLDRIHKVYECFDNKSPDLECPEESFNCGNRCIAARKESDGIIDCADKRDERDCKCDLNNNFRCGGNISCLPIHKRCDGLVDCWDFSDERNCTHLGLCGKNEVPCRNGQCILKDHFCDGHMQCEDQSDEPAGCAQMFRTNIFNRSRTISETSTGNPITIRATPTISS